MPNSRAEKDGHASWACLRLPEAAAQLCPCLCRCLLASPGPRFDQNGNEAHLRTLEICIQSSTLEPCLGNWSSLPLTAPTKVLCVYCVATHLSTHSLTHSPTLSPITLLLTHLLSHAHKQVLTHSPIHSVVRFQKIPHSFIHSCYRFIPDSALPHMSVPMYTDLGTGTTSSTRFDTIDLVCRAYLLCDTAFDSMLFDSILCMQCLSDSSWYYQWRRRTWWYSVHICMCLHRSTQGMYLTHIFICT